MSQSVTYNDKQFEPGLISSGRLGMWWFLASEITIFGPIIAAFVLLRFRHPEWAEQAKHALTVMGFINTLVLITSSYTVVLAHQCAERNDDARAKKFLFFTIILGSVFLVIKGLEYAYKIREGFIPGTHLYWGFYFFMTGLHALHVIIGLVIMASFLVGYQHQKARIGHIGLYWHLVDIVWIFLFPLLYLEA